MHRFFPPPAISNLTLSRCYVGKQRLDLAIKSHKTSHPSDTFSVTWKPFYLNPDAPKQGRDKQAYYHAKFGVDRTAMMQQRLAAIGKSVGINFSFGGKTGNTRDSHRLIQLGKTKSPELQTRVVEELFKAYFENEADITSHDVLVQAGVKAGLDEAEVKEWLASDKGGKEVDSEVAEAQERMINGVPNFTIQGVYEISGAQEPEMFVRTFERIKTGEEQGIANGGAAC
jgi:predicted DsbA family dithiol-disulfide isomerase